MVNARRDARVHNPGDPEPIKISVIASKRTAGVCLAQAHGRVLDILRVTEGGRQDKEWEHESQVRAAHGRMVALRRDSHAHAEGASVAGNVMPLTLTAWRSAHAAVRPHSHADERTLRIALPDVLG